MSALTKYTPWGEAERVSVIADGIVFFSTCSHGGIGLSKERWAEFRQVLPGFQPWAGDGWLEEDCDAVAAAAVWPEYFEKTWCISAVKSFLAYRTDIDASYWKTESGRELLAKALGEER